MATTLSQAFLDALAAGGDLTSIIEITLDSGVIYLAPRGYVDTGAGVHVLPVLKSISSFQNRLDPAKGFATRGILEFVISGRANFTALVRDNYLKNRVVRRMDGFAVSGFAYADFAPTFTGVISGLKRSRDELTVTVADDLTAFGEVKVPVELTDDTQFLDYRDMDPAAIMQDIMQQAGVAAADIDSAAFTAEKDNWLNGWVLNRVITSPEDLNKYLNELQVETNSFIFHDREKISMKVFAPPLPGQSIEQWDDTRHMAGLVQDAGYEDRFFNRVLVYYDYDESGSGDTENFENAVEALDSASQGPAEWDETTTKTIKSRWIRSVTWGSPVNVTGVVIYYASASNGAGTGTLTFTYDAGGEHTLQWTAPGGSIGRAVTISESGKYDVYSSDETKLIRAVVDYSSLPAANKIDSISITSLNGPAHAAQLAHKILTRYRDPVSVVTFRVGQINAVWNSRFIKPTDLKDLTTDEVSEHGKDGWTNERMMITEVKQDNREIKVKAVQTRMYRRYGFVAPAGQADYPTASAGERERAYIGDASNKVNGGTEDGYYIW